jgi:hypothetical protein
MFVMHPTRYRLTDADRGIEVVEDGGNPDGDTYFKMSGEGWYAKFGLRNLPGHQPPLGQLFVRFTENPPFSEQELTTLIEEAGQLILARWLHTAPSEVVATFSPERHM